MTPGRINNLIYRIGAITLICGTLDILDAIIFYRVGFHVPAGRLLRNIAGHLIGASAMTGGAGMAVLGLALHYCIAGFWVSAFVFAAQRVPLLIRRPILSGALHGLLIYAAMNFVVLPLSKMPPRPGVNPRILADDLFALVFLMGVLMAWLNRRLIASANSGGSSTAA